MKPRALFACFCFAAFFLPAFSGFAQDLSIEGGDILIEYRSDGGFHLFIRKKPDISSVLLTESTRDERTGADNYSWRAPEWNAINGDEIRLLNGVPIPRESRVFSLVDSTPENHPELGAAFHIYIPWKLVYGYENGRRGEVLVSDGTYFNIRTFSLPYADYRGSFVDNPYTLSAIQLPPEKPEGVFIEEAEEAFDEIARDGQGEFTYARNPTDLVDKIEDILAREAGKGVDIVLCFDTTGSMKPYIDEVRKTLIPMIKKHIAAFTDYRIGMVLYKDHYDEYVNRVFPFTKDFSVFQRNLNAIRPRGGGDVPEAVYEALNEGAEKFPWEAESRLVILIGDAPPHPKQRGNISKEAVNEKIAAKNLKVNAILLAR